MTTPVHIKKVEDENSMSFVLPRKFNPESASPIDESIKVFENESGYFAAIRYSGYTNESKERLFSKKLQNILEN